MTASRYTIWSIIWRFILFGFTAWMVYMSVLASMIWKDDQRIFSENAIQATGIIVDKEYEKMSGDGDRFKSDDIVEFTDQNGNTVRFTDYTTIDLSTEIGQVVPIRYMPNDPEYAQIDLAGMDTNNALIGWMLIAVAIGFGLVSFFSGRGLLRVLRARRQTPTP